MISPSKKLTAAAVLALAAFAASCNCGKGPPVIKTEASLALEADVLDFGPVPEGTAKGGKFRVDNIGRAPVGVAVTLVAGGSGDFALGTLPTSVEAGGFVEVPVTFTPAGPGEDEAFAEVSTGAPEEIPLRIRLHGGPISAALEFDPDPLDFRPATQVLETKTVRLKSVGGATLEVKNIGVSAAGNPAFSVVPTTLPKLLLPGETMPVQVEYARSASLAEGLMEVNSNDGDAGVRRLRLLPDRPAACADSVDNDQDGRTDFPADPGCDNAADDDESNAGACVNNATRACGTGICVGSQTCVSGQWDTCQVDAGAAVPETCDNRDEDCDGQVDDNLTRSCYSGAIGTLNVGQCRGGQQTCAAGSWGTTCPGEVLPAGSDTCGNNVDDDCDGPVDEGCGVDAGPPDAGPPPDGGCNPNGIYTLDAGSIQYTCCFGLSSIDVTQFQFTPAGGTTVIPGPSQPGTTLTSGSTTTCPSGTFNVSRLLAGGCNETYRLQGNFVGPNTFVGTYTATYSGSQCDCFGGLDTPCTNQSWSISAGR